jgi:glycosyltransferase involved in cell wall biosynthesis
MATYNGATYLSEQLESLARQTRLPDELIISDDCSSDATVEIARAFATTAPFPVHVFVNAMNLGYAKNFVSAARRSIGDLVFFADQDDIWCDDKVAVIADLAASSDGTVFSHDISIFATNPDSPTYASYYQYLRSQDFPPAVCLKGCSLAIKATFITDWDWPSEHATVSHDFWVALLATGLRQRRYVDKVLVHHRLHGENTSGWVASRGDLVRQASDISHQQGPTADLDLLIELCIKPWSMDWTDAFLAVLQRRSLHVDPDLLADFTSALKQNADWYAGRETAAQPFSLRRLWQKFRPSSR